MFKLDDGGATRRKMVTGLLGGIAAAGAAGVAQAQPRIAPPSQPASPAAPSGGIIRKITLDIMEPILTKHGFQNIERKQADNTGPYISAVIKGVPVRLQMNCNDNACSVVYFVAEFGQQSGIDAKYMNAWNTAHAVSALYRIDDDLLFRFGIPVLGGVTEEFLASNTGFFLAVFDRLLTFKPEATS